MQSKSIQCTLKGGRRREAWSGDGRRRWKDGEREAGDESRRRRERRDETEEGLRDVIYVQARKTNSEILTLTQTILDYVARLSESDNRSWFYRNFQEGSYRREGSYRSSQGGRKVVVRGLEELVRGNVN